MQRSRLIRELTRAASPDQIAEALWTARAWLLNHPGDEELREEMQRLIGRERMFVRA